MFGKTKKLKDQFLADFIAVKEKEKQPITSSQIREEMLEELNNWDTPILQKQKEEVFVGNEDIVIKGGLASSLGFVNMPSSKIVKQLNRKSEKIESQLEAEKKEMEYIEKYSKEYPLYKFVSQRVFDEVRKKYGLYTAEPGHYIKEIPNKNLLEIENFSKSHEIEAEKYYRQDHRGAPYEISKEAFLDIMAEQSGYSLVSGKYTYRNKETLLKITAPRDHFHAQLVFDEETREIKVPVLDPIVTKDVEGGKIIITAWDEEAKIPEIQNPLNN